jgi:hypothetical protein
MEWIRTAHQVLKQVDPANQVIVGGFATDGVHTFYDPRGKQNTLQLFYDLGLKECFDIFSIHPYSFDPDVGLVESIDRINTAWSVMERNGDGARRFWVTEIGVPSTMVGEDAQAAYVENAYSVLLKHPCVDKVFWYNFRCKDFKHEEADSIERAFGLVLTDFSPTKAYEKFCSMSNLTQRMFQSSYWEKDVFPEELPTLDNP